MKEISFEEIGSVVVTLRAAGDVRKNCAVGMVDKERVGIPNPNEEICGVAVEVGEDGMASVQVRGFVTVSYTGSIQPGWISLVANGGGGVQKAGADVAGHECLLVSSDPLRRTAVILL